MFNSVNLHPPRVTGPNQKKLNTYFRHRSKVAVNDETVDANPSDAGVYPIGRYPFKVHIRFSNKTPGTLGAVILNTHKAIVNSAVKLKTKRIWTENEIPTPKYWKAMDFVDLNDKAFLADQFENEVGFPVIAKLIQGQQSQGLYRIHNTEELETFCSEVRISDYYFERLEDFDFEYRFHVSPWLKNTYKKYIFQSAGKMKSFSSRDGVILPTKKLLKKEAYRQGIRMNRRPAGFDDIVMSTEFTIEPWMEDAFKMAVKAIEVLGMDFGAVDVGYKSSENRYFFFESVANPGMTSHTAICYQQAFPAIILAKAASENRINHLSNMFNNQVNNIPDEEVIIEAPKKEIKKKTLKIKI